MVLDIFNISKISNIKINGITKIISGVGKIKIKIKLKFV